MSSTAGHAPGSTGGPRTPGGSSTAGLPGASPLSARTATAHRPIAPIAYDDHVQIVVVRDGSAILVSDSGEDPVAVGHVVVLGTNTPCGAEPEGHVTTTTIHIDAEYMVDQVFWQHGDVLHDRLEARRFIDSLAGGPARILRLGMERTRALTPWLDELALLSTGGRSPVRFHRMQSLWSSIADALAPFDPMGAVSGRMRPTAQAPHGPVPTRPLALVREEATLVRDALRQDMTRPWTLEEMAGLVHLSTKQLGRVFAQSYGMTPQSYLTRLRVDELARLLRETDVTISEAGLHVGWRSRSRAAEAFRECTGVTPQRYRHQRRHDGV